MDLDYQFNEKNGGEVARDDTQNADLENRIGDCVTCCNSEGRERGRFWRKDDEFHFGCVEFEVPVR